MVSRNDRWGLLVRLVRKVLDITGGKTWLGRTHIQKAAFFAQQIGDVDLGYEFVIYQYGPYSFELDSDIADLVAVGALERQLVGGYPDYVLGRSASTIEQRVSESTLMIADAVVDVVAKEIASRTAKELELLSTIAYVESVYSASERDEIVERVRSLKPHFSSQEVRSEVSSLAELEVRINGAAQSWR